MKRSRFPAWRLAGWAAILTMLTGHSIGPMAGAADDRASQPADDVDVRVAYYPSRSQLRLLVSTAEAASSWTRWTLRLEVEGQPEPLFEAAGALPMPPAGATLDVPALPEGSHEAVTTLTAADGSRREVRQTIERTRFAWEGSALGRSRVVIPPFTPMTVDHARAAVGCVLREHELNGAGLWAQARSQGIELLAGPMRLEVRVGDAWHAAAGGAIRWEETAADRVRGEAGLWRAGPIRGRTSFLYEYDGLARLELHIEPSEATVGDLRLVIPLARAEAPLMHVVTDLLRFHYAGSIPQGAGRVWDYAGIESEVPYTSDGKPAADGTVWVSSHVARHRLPAPFVPYIWLGGPERGLCWMAENDRDCNLDPGQPALQIRQVDDRTELVVHFINRPTPLDRPRTIAFGLMATPAKPMPEAPVSFRRWWTGAPMEDVPDTVALGFMGACWYWGAAGPFFGFTPAFGNEAIFEEFARLRRGGAIDETFLGRWLAQFSDPVYQSYRDDYRAHVSWSERYFAGGAWNPPAGSRRHAYVTPYTNARGAAWGPETRTFLDEWSTIDVADPRWPGEERFLRADGGGYRLVGHADMGPTGVPQDGISGIAYGADPVESWQDMALHHQRRMLETFADGVYYDDYFLSPNYNPLGPGYIDDEGRVRPGVHLYAFRELTRRTAVMQHELGRRPMVFIHMTNANIVPLLSFGTMILDHEWRDQGDFRRRDFHDRLGLDRGTELLLAQSTGLQSGCLGIVHDLFHGDRRLRRSALGVALTHEMRFGASGDPEGTRVGEILCRFGYGLPACRVWRYWDEPSPVQTEGAACKTLTLAHQGAALIVACSYGESGATTLTLDFPGLGLPDDAVAIDAESGAALPRTGNRITIDLPRHDFRIIRLAGPSSDP